METPEAAAITAADADRRRELTPQRSEVLLTTYGIARSAELQEPRCCAGRIAEVDPAACPVAMSGTPVGNRLLEYGSIMHFAQRGYLGGVTRFTLEFVTPIQTHRDAAAASRQRKVMAPFMLRRLKSDPSIIDDLPDKAVQDQRCSLSPIPVALQETVGREGLKAIAGESDALQRKVQVHRLLTRGTFEERPNGTIRAKRELAELTVGTGETWIGALSSAELKALLKLSGSAVETGIG